MLCVTYGMLFKVERKQLEMKGEKEKREQNKIIDCFIDDGSESRISCKTDNSQNKTFIKSILSVLKRCKYKGNC